MTKTKQKSKTVSVPSQKVKISKREVIADIHDKNAAYDHNEVTLRNIATKGVTALFNTISTSQKEREIKKRESERNLQKKVDGIKKARINSQLPSSVSSAKWLSDEFVSRDVSFKDWDVADDDEIDEIKQAEDSMSE